MTPQISIIVPVYKVPIDLLRRCVESCVRQKNKSIEIILVDDCSPDNCGMICDELSRQYPNIKVIHKKQNGGLAAARNTGFYEARGKWITFVDGDDWIEADMCSIIPIEAENDGTELIFFAAYRDYNNIAEPFKFSYQNGEVFTGKACKQLQLDVMNYYKRLSTAYSKFFNREFLMNNGLIHNEELRMGLEGIDFNVRVFGELTKAVSLNKPLYHYVYNEESYTAVPNENRIKMLLLGLHAISDYIATRQNNSQLIQAFEDRALRSISDVALGIYFNPNFEIKYSERKTRLNVFLEDQLISNILYSGNGKGATRLQKFSLFCERKRLYFVLHLLGKLRIIRMRMK